jgi:hypothetical protein
MLQTQEIGLKRNTIDKYYTSQDAVQICINAIKNNIQISENDMCVEPSAGNGSFIPGIKSLFTNYKFYDLEPEDDEIYKQDYLLFDSNVVMNGYDKIHIVGNPPFGRQSSLSIKFIKKSCEYCHTISFILPKSFKKDSLKKHFPLNFHLVHESDLPYNSFLVDNKPHDVPCVFQIWSKKYENRSAPDKLYPDKYSFVKKDENPDISFRRVGVNAGKIDTEIEKKSEQSHYFIKFDEPISNELFSKLNNVVYQCKDNTVGPKSISKQELIKEFNKLTIN